MDSQTISGTVGQLFDLLKQEPEGLSLWLYDDGSGYFGERALRPKVRKTVHAITTMPLKVDAVMAPEHHVDLLSLYLSFCALVGSWRMEYAQIEIRRDGSVVVWDSHAHEVCRWLSVTEARKDFPRLPERD